MRLVDPLLMEIEHEAAATRRVLERVPDDKLTWRPHPKSKTLGQLAIHVATIPGTIARLAQSDTFEVEFTAQPQPANCSEILAAFEQAIGTAKQLVGGMSDAFVDGAWSMTRGGKAVLTLSRAQMLRTIAMNHLYHHRGQLTVYLRLLDVTVPAVYGPSADENPFSA